MRMASGVRLRRLRPASASSARVHARRGCVGPAMALNRRLAWSGVVLKLPAGEYFQRFGVALARLVTL